MAKIFTGADIILGATTIRQVTNISHASGQEHRKAMNSGGAVVQQVSLKSAVDVTTFTSEDLAALLALLFLASSSLTTRVTCAELGKGDDGLV